MPRHGGLGGGGGGAAADGDGQGGLWERAWRRGSREALAGLASVAAGLVLWELVRTWQRWRFATTLERDLDKADLARVVVAGVHGLDAEAVADVLHDALPGVRPELEIVGDADPGPPQGKPSDGWAGVRAEARRRAGLALRALTSPSAGSRDDGKGSQAPVGLRLAVGIFWDMLELDPETQMPIVWVEFVDADSGQRGSACQVGAVRARGAGTPPLHAYLRHEAIELAWEQFISGPSQASAPRWP